MNEKGLSVKVEKVVERGVRMYKILDFSCYKVDQLPVKYFIKKPYCYENENAFVMEIDGTDGDVIFKKDELIYEKDYKRLIRNMKFCGGKLHDINEEIKQLKKDWTGVEEFKI